MIVYGWNSKLLKEGEIENAECAHCDHKGQEVQVSASYVHLFWIPFFPYNKSTSMVCSNCGKVNGVKKMSAEDKMLFSQIGKSVPFPKWMFSGLALVAVLVAVISFTTYQSGLEKDDFIANPEIGDVYNMKDFSGEGEYDYYFTKIVGKEGDSLTVAPSASTYNMASSKMLSGDGFLPITYNIHKNDVLSYSESGELIDIYRDYGESTGFHVEAELTEEMLGAWGTTEGDSLVFE